jgi:hypothetical protein
MKRRLAVSFGASRIVKAGDTPPQGLIPAHEKFALKADAPCIEARINMAALPNS